MKYYSLTVSVQINNLLSFQITVLDRRANNIEEVITNISEMIGEHTDFEVLHAEEHDKPAHHVELH